MAKFAVYYTERTGYRVDIEAEDEQEARDKFWEFDFDANSVEHCGEDIEDGVFVEELV
jgi:hypothetical protein